MKNKVVKTKKDDDSYNELFETLIMLILALVLVSFIESTENKMSTEESSLYNLQTDVMNIMLYDTPIPIIKSLTEEQKSKLIIINRNIDNCMKRKQQLGVSGLSECYNKNELLFNELKVGYSDRLIFNN
ncbi:TPA: hypothetical protein J1748_003875 [Escherichia coli]|uniref:hypothetical protein n=1 Tax=Enterobacter cloacae complex TaxID=354276 RepID=UPI001079D751|nr:MULTISPECIES: hypothetical protein [Enterobacter cloacae complex]EAB4511034.1 hypothetical protein [Salmonella enterica]EBM9045908.1 hypothetical protein [Salmonella enterica subsp. enterica serovar Schwarzengrund]ECA3013031.1 hypothetical protein [Salmonella enterica subsp. enterica serovar Enteritidis]EHE5694889.1 hypothetical protein [Salmonella enterica subsp. enterica serovar Kentucky]MCM7865377.1 hypothetical protein [Enterobacter hormaechei]HBB0509648.1 hypothetical protein [Escheri